MFVIITLLIDLVPLSPFTGYLRIWPSSMLLGVSRVLNDVLSQERRETESGRAKFPPKPSGIAESEQWLCQRLLASPQLCKQQPMPK